MTRASNPRSRTKQPPAEVTTRRATPVVRFSKYRDGRLTIAAYEKQLATYWEQVAKRRAERGLSPLRSID